jgi:DNA-binding MarR family transcriptional regulator
MSETDEFTNTFRRLMEAFMVRSMRDWFHYIKSSGLSHPQGGLLMHLYYRGRHGVQDIGARMEITSAAASQLIDRLVQSGLVKRTEDPDDRRARQIALSPAGRALIEKGIAERLRWVESLTAALTKEEKAVVMKVLPILIDAEKRFGDPAQARGCRDAYPPGQQK